MSGFKYFEQLKQGLEDAAAFEKGDKSRARVSIREIPVPEYKAADVARLRADLRLSQRGLAFALGVSARTVEAWEAGRNIPSGSARHLLYLFEKDGTLVGQFVER